jgi:hypothetical protein
MKKVPCTVPEAALFYAGLFGWTVFPAPPGTKRSHKSAKYSNGQRWGATNKSDIIRRNFKSWPKANIGIPTGPDNGFWVLDGDTAKGHGVDGVASLRRLERQYGRLPKTLMAISPSGSLHYYFKWPDDPKAVIRNTTSSVAPGVDVRGRGGMVLAPPSIKPDVGIYRFLNWGTPIADAPAWLLQLVAQKKTTRKHQIGQPEASVDLKMIERALNVITAGDLFYSGDYSLWFEIGCALASLFGDSGYEMFDAWSSLSPEYNAETCAAKWDECIKLAPYYGVGTILHYANKADPHWHGVYDAQRFAALYSFKGKRASGQW